MNNSVRLEDSLNVVKDNNTKTRNTCLYFFEACACCLIVFMHCEFPGNFGYFMNSLARFGVPLFFAISGFFLYSEGATTDEFRAKIRKRVFKIFILLSFSFLIYFSLGVLTSCFGNNSISFLEYLKETFHWKRLIFLIVFNDPLTNGINWFMIALLFSYLILYLFPNFFLRNNIVPYIVSNLTFFGSYLE